MRTYLAYAFAWWMVVTAAYTTIIGAWFYNWSEAQGESYSLTFGLGLVILMLLAYKRMLK